MHSEGYGISVSVSLFVCPSYISMVEHPLVPQMMQSTQQATNQELPIFSEMSPLQRSGVAIFTSDMKYIPHTGFTSVSFVASAYNTNIWVRVAGSKDANWLHILHSRVTEVPCQSQIREGVAPARLPLC